MLLWRGTGVIHMQTNWTLTTIEAAVFVALVVGLAGAGTWAAIG